MEQNVENQFVTSKMKQVTELLGVKFTDLKSLETSFISFKIWAF